MASEQGPIASESPLAPPSVTTTSTLPTLGASEVPGSDSTRLRSLKRGRETTPTSPGGTTAPGDLSPAKIARLVTYAQSPLPAPLTGAAALEDERRRRQEEQQRLQPPGISLNPTQRVLSELTLAPNANMSRAQDAPAEVASAAVQTSTNDMMTDIPGSTSAETKATSPQSITSVPSLGSGNNRVVDSPTAMDVDSRNDRSFAPQPDAQMDERAPAPSHSYPGILPSGGVMAAPGQPRGLSLPIPPPQVGELTPRSPSNKKHKCPYCDTEFTRHHNLKSHLLTHSQEKPYICQQCNMRFRRLHDLKRHSKLHTGEKPHICPKCDRKFARADALARHSKGAGGCAGRRSSMGSFIGDEDYDGVGPDADDSAMAGVIYDGAGDGELTEEDQRRLSLPSIKAQHVAAQQAAAPEGYAAHSRSTYPPAGPRPAGASSNLLPPNLDRGTPSVTTSPTMPNSTGSGHTPNTSISSMPLSAGSNSLFSQTGMTESPKPLSPGVGQSGPPGHDKNQRSASLQQQIASRQSEHHAPSGLSAPPPPHGAAANPASSGGLPTAAPPAPPQQSAVGGQATATGGGPATAAGAPPPPPGQVVDNVNNLFATGEQGLWTYIHSLEEKVKTLVDELASVKKVETQLLEKAAESERRESALASELALMRQQLGIRVDVDGSPAQD